MLVYWTENDAWRWKEIGWNQIEMCLVLDPSVNSFITASIFLDTLSNQSNNFPFNHQDDYESSSDNLEDTSFDDDADDEEDGSNEQLARPVHQYVIGVQRLSSDSAVGTSSST